MLILLTGCGIERHEIIENKYGQGHEASIVYEKKRSSGDWERVFFGMKARHLKLQQTKKKN
jgi:hypothetical protein